MMTRIPETSPLVHARAAGILYLSIIVCGLFSELYVRSRLIVSGDAMATATNILASEGLFRVGFASDVVMVLSDVALAIVLYVLLRPVSRTLSLIAASLRLVQSAILGMNLLNLLVALLVLGSVGSMAAFEAGQRQALALLFLDAHKQGYDLGLIFFGVQCLVLGYLLYRSDYVPRILAILMVLAGVAYLVGSFTLFLFPAHVEAVSPVYGVCVVAELSLGLWLLIKGVRVTARGEPDGS